MTAPTPERRVGEAAWLTMDEHEAQGYDLPKRAVGSKSHWLAMADRWAVEAKAQRAAVARLTAEVERMTAVELRYRKELWLGHGHDHLYGDDGEMQCTQCAGVAWDYRRAPLEVIERAAWEARQICAALSLPTPAPVATE